MESKNPKMGGYILSAGLGALGGSIIFAVLTNAIPKMMAAMMSGMMENMISQMGGEECDPAEI